MMKRRGETAKFIRLFRNYTIDPQLKLLADRALARLSKEDWLDTFRALQKLEENK